MFNSVAAAEAIATTTLPSTANRTGFGCYCTNKLQNVGGRLVADPLLSNTESNKYIGRSFIMSYASLVTPPEHHIFQRGDRYLISDPVSFLWFVTDESGKITFESLVKNEDPTAALAQHWGVEKEDPSARTFVDSFVENLLKVGFLHRDQYQPRDWHSGLQFRPTILYIHLSTKCNLRCPYCYNQEHRTELIQIGKQSKPSGVPTATEPNTAKLLEVIDEAAGLGFKTVKLTGGEALLNKDALLIARHAKKRGLSVNLLTNATTITESMVKEIAEVVDSVSISLDSDKAEEHDAVRGQGTHAQVLRSINMLKEAHVKHLHLNAVITPVNLHSVTSFLDYAWNKLKADQVTIAPTGLVVDDPNNRWRAGEYQLSGDEYLLVSRQEREFHQRRNEKLSSRPKMLISNVQMFRRHCGVGNGLLSIEANGDIYPCQTLHKPEFLTGNAFSEKGLTNLLENSSPVLEKVRSATVDRLPECKTCPVRYICAGGCRSEAYSREGNFFARDRAMCPTHFENSVNSMWEAATIPVNEESEALVEYRKKGQRHSSPAPTPVDAIKADPMASFSEAVPGI